MCYMGDMWVICGLRKVFQQILIAVAGYVVTNEYVQKSWRFLFHGLIII